MAYALAKLDSENTAAIDCLVEAVGNKAGDRRAAISALGNLGPRAKPAVPVLITVLADPDYNLPTAAAYALRNIGPAAKAAAPSLAAALARVRTNTSARLPGRHWPGSGPRHVRQSRR